MSSRISGERAHVARSVRHVAGQHRERNRDPVTHRTVRAVGKMPTAAGTCPRSPARGTHALPRRPFALPAPFLKLRANEIEAARAQFFVPANQPTRTKTAKTRLN